MLTYRDLDETVAIANGTQFGLSGAVSRRSRNTCSAASASSSAACSASEAASSSACDSTTRRSSRFTARSDSASDDGGSGDRPGTNHDHHHQPNPINHPARRVTPTQTHRSATCQRDP
ncbi:hypothetical protein [Pseudofrankia sp. BMG5.37]|uniref:hypothetical protein n=1 Tax=Pseudofrankia sp. BMG5.37 TaxID=3050035 RepID=UPI0037CAAAEC